MNDPATMLISPYIRLSEVQDDWLPEGNPSSFTAMLERLAVDGQLEVHGQHVWIIDEFEEQVSDWQLIAPAGLSSGEWDWMVNVIRFDPNERPDYGVNPRYFRNVSFNRAELFEWLERHPVAQKSPTKRARGRPRLYNWEKICSIARTLAENGYESQNAFFTDLAGTLEEQNLKVPAGTTLKTNKELKQIAELAEQNGRKKSN